MNLQIVILAAGQSKRMNSSQPKVLHNFAGIPILERILQTVQKLKPQDIHVIYGHNGDLVSKTLANYPLHWYPQDVQLGTAHALAQALPSISDDSSVLVLVADIPLISDQLLTKLMQHTPQGQFGLITAKLQNPTGMGRILRNDSGELIKIVEEKDASLQEKAICEINTGIIIGAASQFKAIIPKLNNNNAQSEYYLTDVINIAAQAGQKINTIEANEPEEVMGINNRCQFEHLERYYQRKTAESLMLKGVTIRDSARFDMRGTWEINQDTLIDVDVVLEGNGVIGSGCKIGPFTILKNVTLGENVEIKAHSVIEDAIISDHCIIGPFARIRPGTKLAKQVHVGNFVEIKNSEIADGSKINHLSYIGDTTMGSKVNVGAGAITCNYDGINKYRTTIKNGVFIGSDTQLIAPVTVYEGATIAAGSTITKDVPSQTLTRNKLTQVLIEDWQRSDRGKKM